MFMNTDTSTKVQQTDIHIIHKQPEVNIFLYLRNIFWTYFGHGNPKHNSKRSVNL